MTTDTMIWLVLFCGVGAIASFCWLVWLLLTPIKRRTSFDSETVKYMIMDPIEFWARQISLTKTGSEDNWKDYTREAWLLLPF
jgi:hypothetical protein